MPREEAREFDARLNRTARGVTNEIRFRMIGSGDPAGAVTGARVIRAEILSARLLDPFGNVVYTPRVTPYAAVADAAGSRFDLASADIAGLRVGVKARDLEASLNRLVGPVTRRPAGDAAFPGLLGKLSVNELGCVDIPGRRTNPEPGSVCVTAFFDDGEIVRLVRIERVFRPHAPEAFRTALVRRYGNVAAAHGASNYILGWGPEVDPALVYDRAGPRHALTAYYLPIDDLASRSANRAPDIRLVLQLVDAQWAATRAQ